MRGWLALLLCAAVPTGIHAQPLWTARFDGGSVSAEWLKPSLNEDGADFFTSALFLSGRFVFSRHVRLVGEVPVARLRAGATGEAFIDLGNPYVGFELYLPGEPVWLEAGARAALLDAGPSAALAGVAADFERVEAFLPDVLTLQALGNYRYARGAFSLRARAGASFLFDTAEGGSDSRDVFVRYGGQGWYAAGPVHLGAGLTGRALATGEAGSAAQRTFHEAALSAFAAAGRFYPGLLLHLPLDGDLRALYDAVFGPT